VQPYLGGSTRHRRDIRDMKSITARRDINEAVIALRLVLQFDGCRACRNEAREAEEDWGAGRT
jgi:hypothetical protein